VTEPVKIIECPRDAWQGLPLQIPTDRKVEYLRGLVGAGFRHIDAVSFVSPKAVPQMADSEEVLRRLGPAGDLEIIGIVVNEKGAERAVATGAVSTLGFPCSVSETFLQRNQKQSNDENRAVLKQVKAMADKASLGVVAYISMGFGNPYGDPWSEQLVADAVKEIADIGISAISLADTVGLAASDLIQRVVTNVLRANAGLEVGVHLHSTREDAGAKVLAAYDAGCRRFDSAVGGLGGCPFAQNDLVGNVPTEEVAQALQRRGVELPIHLSKITTLNAAITDEFS
jgi:hydroxymethylglutaryl-CoA lyase